MVRLYMGTGIGTQIDSASRANGINNPTVKKPLLDSLEIRNFRLFRHLVLPELGAVNLIVGKNNSGKSCLLEALYLYEGCA
jgi:predicted GTPase